LTISSSELQPNTPYTFQVRAECAIGQSDWSAEASCTTPELQIIPRDSCILMRNPKTFDGLLCRMFGKTIKLRLLYRGSRDGFNAADFHRTCDSAAQTLTVVLSGDHISGGFATKPWTGGAGYTHSDDGWLYSLQPVPIKLTCSQPQYIQYSNPIFGPSFGDGHDLHIDNDMKSTNNYYSHPCSNFQKIVPEFDGTNDTTLFGSYNFVVDEIEVFEALSLLPENSPIRPTTPSCEDTNDCLCFMPSYC